jgi:hypothetical protein
MLYLKVDLREVNFCKPVHLPASVFTFLINHLRSLTVKTMKARNFGGLFIAVATLAAISPQASAQTQAQLRGCQNFVSSLSGYISTVPRVNILVSPLENRTDGLAVVGWRTSDGTVSGNCVVAPNGEVFEYRKDRARRPGGSAGAVDVNWGQRLTGGLTGEILSGPPVTLYSRPNSTGQPIGQLPAGDQVTFVRSYIDGGVTWLLTRGGRGQEGWLDARRVTQRNGSDSSNPQVEGNWGQAIRPYQTQVLSSSLLGQLLGAGAPTTLELQSRPNKEQPIRYVGSVSASEPVTVTRRFSDGTTDWALIRGSRGQEGWINSRRLSQY